MPLSTPCVKSVIYTDIGAEQPTLWRVGIDGGEPVQLTTAASRLPSVSADGKFIACLYADEQTNMQWRIAILPVTGGAPKPLTRFEGDQIFGFEWSPDRKQLICTRGIWERNLVLIRNFR